MPEAAFASKSHELVHTPRASAKQQRIAFHERPILRIGAAPSAHIVLDGPGVAEEHCRVELSADGRLTLIDRGSTAGTWLNGGRCVERMPLREGDEIKVGEHIFRVSAAQIRADAIAERLSAHTDWNDEERIRALKSEAEAWRARGRPARLLLPPARLQRASPLALQHPQLQEWFEASAARLRLAQGIRAWLLGFLPGALIGLLAAWPALSPDRPPDRPPDHLADHLADHPTPAPTQPALIPASCTERRVRPDPHEILQDIAVDLGVDHVELARTNNLELLAAPPLPELSACTQRLPLTRVDHIHVVQRDETWEILANRYRLALDRLRRYNPDLPRPLRAGDHVRLRIDPATLDQHQIPPNLVVPLNGITIGTPQQGALLDGIRLSSERGLYDIRCPGRAFGASSAVQALVDALRRLRDHDNYRGQIIIGDLSIKRGGEFGTHLSHKSGRDVDIWLPIVGGIYGTAPRCRSCDTYWCKVKPEQIDWHATLLLVRALRATGRVDQIFLNHSNCPDESAELRTLTTFQARHTRHLHVRFQCGPNDRGCRD